MTVRLGNTTMDLGFNGLGFRALALNLRFMV